MSDEIPKAWQEELSRKNRECPGTVTPNCPDVSHETSMVHDFWAEQDQYRRGWLAKFHMPRGGVVTVRQGNGVVALFPDRREAEITAKRAFLDALNAGGARAPMRGKTILVRKANGRRRYSLIGA